MYYYKQLEHMSTLNTFPGEHIGLDVCAPANAALLGFFVIVGAYVIKHRVSLTLEFRSIAPLIVLVALAISNAIQLDVFCRTNHTTYAWFLAWFTLLAFAAIALCAPPMKKEEASV
jgi:hypothetical protein